MEVTESSPIFLDMIYQQNMKVIIKFFTAWLMERIMKCNFLLSYIILSNFIYSLITKSLVETAKNRATERYEKLQIFP